MSDFPTDLTNEANPFLCPVPDEDHWANREGRYYNGLVNRCIYGSQCEGHACYCVSPKANRRKCGEVGWGKTAEQAKIDGYNVCPHLEPNPYYAGSMEATFEALKAAGKAHDVP